jgi:ribosomal protein S18 acetylase RimI-like enzyme
MEALISLNEIDELQRLNAARLIITSLPKYYQIFGIDSELMVSTVSKIIGVKGTEIERGIVLTSNHKVVGILTNLNGKFLKRSWLIGIQMISKLLPGNEAKLFKNHVKKYDANIGEIPQDSVYISRIAVIKECRSIGIGEKLIQACIKQEEKYNKDINCLSLQVDINNKRAVKFYLKNGFSIYSSNESYYTMLFNY